jgi:hypothetical protein
VMWCCVPKESSQEKTQTRARAASCYGDGSITVRLDGRVFTEAPLTSAASFSVNSNYKPQLTLILLRIDGGGGSCTTL